MTVIALVIGAFLFVEHSYAQIVVRIAPPAPRVEERVAPPSSAHIWIDGHWTWVEGRWTWFPGHWEVPPRPRAVWIPGHWKHRRDGWVWMEGHWRGRRDWR